MSQCRQDTFPIDSSGGVMTLLHDGTALTILNWRNEKTL